ncbi:MAG TPA: TerB family tellurite resistance protein [Ilumatobacteraceae bacterium]|nr:TerB family tellurite resistance protein [Ilumatobacteraceae bacterium]
MNQRLRDMYGHVSVHATADREHEAVIELLLLVMVADRHITIEEVDEIRNISDDSGWESSTFSFDQYLGPAMAKVRTAVSEHSVEALLDDIDDRISSSVLRQSLFSAARDVAGVDHDLAPEEESLLGQVAARFG